MSAGIALALGLSAAVAATPARAAESVPVPISARSGLPWASGAYIPGDRVSDQTAFGSWRGAPTDVVVTWPARRTWSDITNPSWLISAWKGAPQTKSFGIPPFPEGVGGSLASCSSGAYTAQWQTFARTMQASGMASTTIIRLGWEFTGDWYAWAARSPKDFAGCWRSVFNAVEPIAPALRWDFNVNRGTSQLGIDPADAYPGDRYVDIVGVDSYDGYPAATSESGWKVQYAGPYGLKHWLDFAVAHGKKLSVPEWGVYPGSAWAGHNGGDNAFYIHQMFGFFRANASHIAYESYFNESASYYAGALSMNPKAASAYRSEIVSARALGGRVGTDEPSTGGTPTPTPTPTFSATTAPTPVPTTTSSSAPSPTRPPATAVPLPTVRPTMISRYDAAGVALSPPVVRSGADGVRMGSAVSVRNPRSFSGLRLVVSDSSGRVLDRGRTAWCVTVREVYNLRRFDRLASGHYTVRAAYSVDGRHWVSGPSVAFDVW